MRLTVDLHFDSLIARVLTCPWGYFATGSGGTLSVRIKCIDGVLVDDGGSDPALLKEVSEAWKITVGDECPMCEGDGEVLGFPRGSIRKVEVEIITGRIFAANQVYWNLEAVWKDVGRVSSYHPGNTFYDYTTLAGEKTCRPHTYL